jgi:hypothetical protein
VKTFASFLVAPLLLPGLLAGCSGGGGVEGIRTSGDTTATLLTNRSAQQVAVCLADGLHAAAQPDGAGFVVTSASTDGGAGPVHYRVHPIEDKLARFVTQVEQVGSANSESFVAATCLLGPAAPRA